MKISSSLRRPDRTIIFALGIAAAALLVQPLAAASTAGSDTRPNLLLITIDALRPDRLSCYSPIFLRTPVIDGLAARGILFEKAFAHTSLTLPSHANILLGMTPPFHGVSENSKTKVGNAFLTLAEHLKASGFATGAFVGAFPLDSRFGLDQGFDVYDDAFPTRSPNPFTFSERKAEDVLASARAWISGRTTNWFCWVHLWDPHAPYNPPEPYATKFKNDPYSGEAAYVDAALGLFFAGLKSSGRWDRTVIVLTSDHGESLGEHGEMTHSFFSYNSTIHVPLIIAGPGIPASRKADEVGHFDIFPTVCRSLGLPAPAGLQGRPLNPLWEGKTLPVRPIYFEALDGYLNRGCAPLRGFIEGGMKFMASPIPELYDLSRDFAEKTNRASQTDLTPFRKKLDALRASLDSPARKPEVQAVDRETRERLRSLGYTVATGAPTKTSFGAADDLKSFLPYEQKLERAILSTDRGDMEAGIKLFEELIRERKDFTAPYTYLAQVQISRNRIQDAIRVMETGLRNNPDNYSLLSAYGTILVQAGQNDPAIGILEQALAIIDDDPEVWDNLGLAYFSKGNLPRALEYFRRAIALDKTFALAYSNLGVLYLTRSGGPENTPDDLPKALENLIRAVTLDPTLNLAFRGLGVAQKTAGKTAEAISAWEKAAALNPGDGFSVISLATACLESGQKQKARTALENYLKTNGDTIAASERAQVLDLIEKSRQLPGISEA